MQDARRCPFRYLCLLKFLSVVPQRLFLQQVITKVFTGRNLLYLVRVIVRYFQFSRACSIKCVANSISLLMHPYASWQNLLAHHLHLLKSVAENDFCQVCNQVGYSPKSTPCQSTELFGHSLKPNNTLRWCSKKSTQLQANLPNVFETIF